MSAWRIVAGAGLGLVAWACTADGPPEATSGAGALAGRAGVAVEPRVRAALGVPFTDAQLAEVLRLSPLPPVPPDPTNAVADDPRAAVLGQRLFFDTRLSPVGLSCAGCHDPALGFADGLPLGAGRPREDGRSIDAGRPLDDGARVELRRHTQSLWNVGHQRWFFWDGRRDTLWSQALVPLEHPDEMAGSRVGIARVLQRDLELRAEFEALFGPLDLERFPDLPQVGRPPTFEELDPAHPDPLHRVGDVHLAWRAMSAEARAAVDRVFVGVGKALAAYQRRLVSRRAPFDVFVEGLREGDLDKLAALEPAARRGLALFVGEAGCTRCHSGPIFSDLEFHNIGLPVVVRGHADLGRHDGLRQVQGHPFEARGAYSDAPDSELARKLDYLLPVGALFDPTQHDHRPTREELHHVGAFKTPTLRNAALSPPYMHDGRLADLDAVLQHYSVLNGSGPRAPAVEPFLRPLGLDAGQRADLAAFLESLTVVDAAPELLRDPRG